MRPYRPKQLSVTGWPPARKSSVPHSLVANKSAFVQYTFYLFPGAGIGLLLDNFVVGERELELILLPTRFAIASDVRAGSNSQT